MAQPDAAFNFHEGFNAQADIVNVVADIRHRSVGGLHDVRAEDEYENPEGQADFSQLYTLAITDANGSSVLPTQEVTVTYLRQDQKLVLPEPLTVNMLASAVTQDAAHIRLRTYYWKVQSIPYAELRTRVHQAPSLAAFRALIDAMPAVAFGAGWPNWADVNRYELVPGQLESTTAAAMTYAYVSQALGFNCDLRDCSKLATTDYRLTDGAWKTVETAAVTRLSVKMYPYTMQCVAALNYLPCANVALAAWVRAYGVATGVLASLDSRTQKEYRVVRRQPVAEHMVQIQTFERNMQTPLYPLAMNIIAMFGLMHLSKDHTYRANDPNLLRIGVSYINAVRTICSDDIIETMKNNQEVIVRTAAHPFGLGQTYFVARFLGLHRKLASPLQLRLDASPPTVQRVMICLAAKEEWSATAPGNGLNVLYAPQYQRLEQIAAQIRQNPCAFSGLYQLYGEAEKVELGKDVLDAAETIMPMVYGFAMAYHKDEEDKKDGIALAMSLGNVARSRHAQVEQLTKLWEDYYNSAQNQGLIVHINEALKAQEMGAS